MTEDSESIDGLIDQFQSGIDREREEAFRHLYQRFHSPVRRFFERKGFSEEESLDLTQETFLRVFQTLDIFRQDSRFETWLFAVAINVYRNKLRRHAAPKREGFEVSLDHAIPEVIAREAESLKQVIEKERIEALRAAIKDLPPRMRNCLTLLMQGFSVSEISRVLGITSGTVRAHIHLAKQHLRTKLGEPGKFFDEL